MICAACHGDVPGGARFCPSCGVQVAAPVPRRGLRKTVTILFCDMTGSTELSGRLDAESLHEIMFRYYALMRECLERHGGTVEKFIGDAVVGVFGVPVLREDDARRALRAAAEMLEAVESLNRDLRAQLGIEIGVRIGVNTGEVVASEDTSSGQALAAGEPVNVAARLQTAARPGEILIGPVTRELAGNDAVLAAVPELTLKGVARPVTAWRLVALEPPAPSRQVGADEPFFGRRAELDQLTRVLDDVIATASCQLVTITGEPGAGKTRLAGEFAAIAAGRSVLIGIGRCGPYGAGTTLAALTDALRQVVGAARECGALPHPAGADPAAADLAGADGAGADGAGADLADALASLESPGQLPWAAALLLETIGRRRPVLLVLDDLQAAKDELLHVVRQVAGRIAGAAVLLLGLGRPELLDTPAWGDQGTVLSLGPLSAHDATLLVASLSEVTPHLSGLTEQIVARAGGNPFFLEQLVAITSQAGSDSLPPTVRSVIAARLDLLGPVEQDVLLRAAVPGARFSSAELAALLQAEPVIADQAEQALGRLTRRRLLVPELGAYRFSGVLVREVAYHTLPKRARLQYHEVLAQWYRHQMGGPDQVGLHLERAYRLAAELSPADQRVLRIRADAAQSLSQAGTQALGRGDLHWAADLLGQALDLYDAGAAEALTVRVRLAETRLLLGTDPDAREVLRVLAGSAGDPCAKAHARLLLAALELPGPAAIEEALGTVPVFEAAGDQLGLARAWLRVGQLRQLAGRYGDAEEPLRRALRHAVRGSAQMEVATAVAGLAISLWRGPVPVPAALAGCEALLASYGGTRRMVRATVGCPRAVLLGYRGESGPARTLVRDSIRIINELGHVYGAAAMQIFAARVEGLDGEWEQAAALLRAAGEASGRHGDTLAASAAAAGLARSLLEQGRPADALDAAGPVAVTGDPLVDAEVSGVRARGLAVAGRDFPAAVREARHACALAAATDSVACLATAELDRAQVLHAAGQGAEAVRAARAARRLFGAKGHLVGVRRAEIMLGPARHRRDGR
jgi:class 3 adenylate cyclase/tetratricopeptide (TPR) repeat protein